MSRSLNKAVSRTFRGAEEAIVREVCDQVSRRLFTSNSRSGPAFRAISTLAGKKRTPKSFSVFSEEGKVLEGAKALHWFAGYFEELLDVPPTKLGDRHHRDETLDCRSPHQHLLPSSPTISENEKALGGMKSGKEAGVCGISAGLQKAGGGAVMLGLAE